MPRVTDLSSFYGMLCEPLPEDFANKQLEKELQSKVEELNQIFDADTIEVKRLISHSGVVIEIDRFKQMDFLVCKAFPYKKEEFTTPRQIAYRLFANWWLCKLMLDELAREQINCFNETGELLNSYSTDQIPQEKRRHYIQYTRQYQNFIGYSVNITRLIEQYDFVLSAAKHKLDHSIEVTSAIGWAWIYEDELTHGAKEILLQGNAGRYTAPALIRTCIEVTILRSFLFDTSRSIKYKGKEFDIQKGKERSFLEKVLKSMDSIGFKWNYSTSVIQRLYEWCHVVIHKAHRMPLEQMWWALLVASWLQEEDSDEALSLKIDELLDKLLSDGTIKMVEKEEAEVAG